MSRNENDVEQKEEIQDEKPLDQHQPIASSKNSEKEYVISGATESTPPVSKDEEDTPTTKSRYVNIHRFRSTTSKPVDDRPAENSSLLKPASKLANSSQIEKIDRDVLIATTAIPTTIALSSTTTAHIVPEKPTAEDIVTGFSKNTTMMPVKDSDREIVTSALPSSSILSSSSTVRNTVSQPRPFGFLRRNRPVGGTAESTSVTTPLTLSDDQSRPKVSIPSRKNPSRSYRPRHGQLRQAGGEQVGNTERNTFVDHGRTRNDGKLLNSYRGTSKYTATPAMAKVEEVTSVHKNSNATMTVTTEEGTKRKYRRPTSRASTETKTIEENSNVLRIVQAYPRSVSSSVTAKYGDDKESDERITNIKVFKRPDLNKDIYGRTNATRKNNEETKLVKENENMEYKEKTTSYLYATASTLDTVQAQEEKIESPLNQIQKHLNNSVVTINDLDSIRKDRWMEELEDKEVKTMTTSTIKLVAENEVMLPSNNTKTKPFNQESYISMTQETPNLSQNVTNVQFEIKNGTTDLADRRNGEFPRRKKVLLIRRPLTSSSTSATIIPEQKDRTKQIIRKRKVIRRLRPAENVTEVNSTDNFHSAEKQESPGLLVKVTTLPPYTADTEISTTNLDIHIEDSSILDDVTEESVDSVIESAKYQDKNFVDDFTRVTLETPIFEATTFLSESGIDLKTILTNSTSSHDFIKAEVTFPTTDNKITDSVESTMVTSKNDVTFVPNYETFSSITPSSQFLPTDSAQSMTPSSNSQSSTRNSFLKQNAFDSRYVRKKFIRRRPISSAENTTSRYAPFAKSIFSTTDQGDLTILSKRRKSLFIRRRPVLSTATGVTEITEPNFHIQEEGKDHSNYTTLRINLLNDVAVSASSPSTRSKPELFWNRYTSASNMNQHRAIVHLNDQQGTLFIHALQNEEEDVAAESDKETHEVTANIYRKPEFHPRYNLQDSFRRSTSNEKTNFMESTYSLDPSSENIGNAPEANGSNYTSGFRQPRTRYRNRDTNIVTENDQDNTQYSVTLDRTTQNVKSRSYTKRPIMSTEVPVTETLIPAKKFDYVADAHKRQQSLKINVRQKDETTLGYTDSVEDANTVRFDLQNLIEYATTPSSKPLITRLVTSVKESATTERQKILIKTKYSSLTSTTRIPIQNTRQEYQSTTATTPLEETLQRTTTNFPGKRNEAESENEIRRGMEMSTLPIESEFLHAGRFTTESQEPSTIEIESVFSNLIVEMEPKT
ncbi:hypothetical protein KM043_017575 [Ampulex compressa]|nr:hypothetical protein KM043_017575 [Ampulex compressa]